MTGVPRFPKISRWEISSFTKVVEAAEDCPLLPEGTTLTPGQRRRIASEQIQRDVELSLRAVGAFECLVKGPHGDRGGDSIACYSSGDGKKVL